MQILCTKQKQNKIWQLFQLQTGLTRNQPENTYHEEAWNNEWFALNAEMWSK